eukprot:CAMPEP_0114330990 /NCGR_PEP_ID=MMETSP0101-20121206/2111_1 /TAXON_ID=38822 ORGANISM="Pteridomonas danica, Strain PT" /NCGR_SAMPLE_ID=MMETSP0101 /ASSEMBLY_ACC=CAM_ASM_000211 /LENGTH=38 /DNA_ID= /DNA_START= /DNA_END= /DNA_ORIENTATION=
MKQFEMNRIDKREWTMVLRGDDEMNLKEIRVIQKNKWQ